VTERLGGELARWSGEPGSDRGGVGVAHTTPSHSSPLEDPLTIGWCMISQWRIQRVDAWLVSPGARVNDDDHDSTPNLIKEKSRRIYL